MKTPINGARLSSPFGMKTSIDGFNKMHRVLTPPMGTIMASGSGVVKGWLVWWRRKLCCYKT